MAIPCRCHNRINGKTCNARKSLAQHPDQYTSPGRIPRCPSCNARKWYVDKYRLKHEVRGHGDTCGCGGYWFLHRKGSKWCDYNPNRADLENETRGLK